MTLLLINTSIKNQQYYKKEEQQMSVWISRLLILAGFVTLHFTKIGIGVIAIGAIMVIVKMMSGIEQLEKCPKCKSSKLIVKKVGPKWRRRVLECCKSCGKKIGYL